MSSLLRTPLHALHVELGAKMVPFAGYDMPVQYPTGVMAEHKHTRAAAGLFDVSHMGQVRLVGPDAAAALETLVPVDIVDLDVFKQRYALFTNEQGGLLDDLMVCRRPDDLFVVVNAGCKEQDIAHMRKHIGSRCEVIPVPERALLAKDQRQLSNGCVRLEDAERLGRWLMGKSIAKSGPAPEQRIDLPTLVPVYITYLTAAPTPQGTIAFRNDVYGRDGASQLAMNGVSGAAGSPR